MGDNLKDWEAKGFKMIGGKLVKSSSVKQIKQSSVQIPVHTTESLPEAKKHNKYRNRKVVAHGIEFDSEKEADYYSKLILLKKTGTVKNFEHQKRYDIIVNDKYIAHYKLDFFVEYTDGRVEHVDIKGFDKKTGKFVTTPLFNLKKKLVEAIYGITIIKRSK
jgi:hypothetical protein